ncbi:MAG: hypothetical protein QOK17_2353 [Sphingomonadales bacterium]|jgi:uncharacterized protein YecT (DUF1311 family)|nr:hypothetical protein [Sphingomonadales bacterium]
MKAAALALALGASLAAAPAARWDWGDTKDEFTSTAEYAPSKALCRQLKDREPPAGDRPGPAAARALDGCDSEKLYYGIGMPADPVKARQCALLEAESGNGDGPFSGRAMLMTIYANGKGAAKNLEIAIHLACGIEGAPMEMIGRIGHLAERRAKGWRGDDFDYCDDITSGNSGGQCAEHAAEIERARRDAVWARLTAAWSPAEKQALARMKAVHNAFAQAHAEGEIDMSGTLRGAFYVDAVERLDKALLAMVQKLEAGRAPALGHAQFVAADAALNARYRKALQSIEPSDAPGTVTRDGIRSAQRAWLAYRDAFLAFAALRYPKVPRETLAAWLTAERTKMWDEGEED